MNEKTIEVMNNIKFTSKFKKQFKIIDMEFISSKIKNYKPSRFKNETKYEVLIDEVYDYFYKNCIYSSAKKAYYDEFKKYPDTDYDKDDYNVNNWRRIERDYEEDMEQLYTLSERIDNPDILPNEKLSDMICFAYDLSTCLNDKGKKLLKYRKNKKNEIEKIPSILDLSKLSDEEREIVISEIDGGIYF